MEVHHLEACFLDSTLNVESVTKSMVLNDGDCSRHGCMEWRGRLKHSEEALERSTTKTGRLTNA